MTDRYSTLRRGLIAAWCPSLGATGYTVLDRSGRNRHAPLTNMGGQVNWPASGSGTAIAFDGANDWASIPASAEIGAAVWCSFWFRLTATLSAANRYTLLIASWESSGAFRQNLNVGVNQFGFGVSEGTTRLNVLTNDLNATPTISGAYTAAAYGSATNVWYHLSAGWDARNTAWRIFVNGVEDTIAHSDQRAATAQPLAVGSFGGLTSFGRYTPVQMDDIRLYNRVLTLAETRLLASQRGIGLVPTRHRRARLASATNTVWLNVGGVWKATTPKINVGGTWKTATPKINVSGTWKG